MLSFTEFQQQKTLQFERVLEKHLPSLDIAPQRLHEAMRYSSLNGGKRVRALLTYATAHLLEQDNDMIDSIASSIECIHAYSLIHDDLPAMDDDDLRRGKPSCHKKFDKATAILAGDALQTQAFKILSDCDYSADDTLSAINDLAISSSSRGMVGGQAIDLAFIGRKISLPELENMHIHKTGALIRSSVTMCAGLTLDKQSLEYKHLKHYAECIGLAFQVQDDILDESATTATLGKTQGKDKEAGKPTYASLLGLRGAKKMANDLYENALLSLSSFDQRAD